MLSTTVTFHHADVGILQHYMDTIRQELAAARALTASTRQEATAQVAAMQSAVDALTQRAMSAEAELAVARTEGLRLQQAARLRVLEVDDREDEYKEQIQQLQHNMDQLMEQMSKEGAASQRVRTCVFTTKYTIHDAP